MVSILLDKCCLCISLLTGAFIMGYVLVIKNSIMMFLMGTQLVDISFEAAKHPNLATHQNSQKPLIYAKVFFYTLQMVFSINLLIGLHKRKLKHVRKHYIVYPVLMVCVTILLIIPMFSSGKEYIQSQWPTYLRELVIIVFECYSIFIVRRCYVELKAGAATSAGVVYNDGNV